MQFVAINTCACLNFEFFVIFFFFSNKMSLENLCNFLEYIVPIHDYESRPIVIVLSRVTIIREFSSNITVLR